MSSRHSRLSKPIDALIRVISSSGFVSNRPPHVRWASRCAGGLSSMAGALPCAGVGVKRRHSRWARNRLAAILVLAAALGLNPVDLFAIQTLLCGPLSPGHADPLGCQPTAEDFDIFANRLIWIGTFDGAGLTGGLDSAATSRGCARKREAKCPLVPTGAALARRSIIASLDHRQQGAARDSLSFRAV